MRIKQKDPIDLTGGSHEKGAARILSRFLLRYQNGERKLKRNSWIESWIESESGEGIPMDKDEEGLSE